MEMKMRNLALILMAFLAVFAIAGCNDDDNPVVYHTPLTPQGVYTVTGDHAVYLYFNGVYDQDVKEYVVYRSAEATQNYSEIGRVTAESNPNLDLLIYEYVDQNVTNGVTYYYAVASVDYEGNVSDLSAETAYDTPRPQGEVTLFPKQTAPTLAGFNLETANVVAWNSMVADVYVDTFLAVPYINVAYTLADSLNETQTDIMDMGYTSNFDEISVSPSTSTNTGWSALGYYEIVAGHTYVIWTRNNHFAKMRAVSLNGSGSITFQWAYQTATGNPELAPALNPPKRPVHDPNFLKKQYLSVSAR
jgi:hypothetical protein